MSTTYDGIIIGGGHNGLILSGYLSRAGLRILLVEAQVEVGGGLDSHEDPVAPGHWHNIHSVFHRGVSSLPWFKDLTLADYGVEYVVPDVGVTMALPDGSSLTWYTEPERTAASLAARSPGDARTFLDWCHRYQALAREVAVAEMYSPPVPAVEKQALLERFSTGREYLDFARYSPVEVICEHFRDDAIRAFLTFLIAMRGFEVDARGFGFFVPTMCATGVSPQLCRGSSHFLADTLQVAVTHAGVDIIEASAVTEILIQDGRACGVRLSRGEDVYAKHFICSSLNPRLTFVDLIRAEEIDPSIRTQASNFRFSSTTPIFALNLALSEPPRYLAEAKNPDIARSFMVIVGLWSLQQVLDLVEDTRAGKWPRHLFMNGACPSILDPTQAPPGGQTAFMWQLAPYRLNGAPEHWDDIGSAFADGVFAKWVEYAPNLARRGVVRNRLWASPLDIERHDANMTEGDWMVGELTVEQAFDKRPLPGMGQYRTPIEGLYLCGSSSHPYGNITGGPGYNAAAVILEDLGLSPWWSPRPISEQWRRLAEREGA